MAKKLQKSYFDVVGLCCTSEVPVIETLLRPLEGIKEITVIVPTRTLIVIHDELLISQTQIVKALNQARLEANVRVKGEENYKKKWPSPYAIACGLLLLLSLLRYLFRPFRWLALGAVAVGILPIALKSFAAIRNLRLDINILAVVAVVGTIALDDYLEAAAIVFLFTIAEWLESRASYKANAVMSSLMSITPQKAVIADTGEVVDADAVKLNTVIAVKAGEVIPIDGIVVGGNCEVDEKTLTGESFPVAKQRDANVWAGTVNLNGYIRVRTTTLSEDCVVAKMAKLVEEAQNNKSRTQIFVDKCARFYTPAVLVMSICIAVIPAVLRVHNVRHWFHIALIVLVSACPCALILSTPVATFCALTKAATSGILIKGGDYLEVLGKIKVMAFDKTGTITRGEFVVLDFQAPQDEISLDILLFWVSSIESKSSHPMAAALVDYGRSLSVDPKPDRVEDFQNFPGEGIHGKIDGHDIYIGNRKIADRAGCKAVPNVQGETKDGRTIGFVFCGGRTAGIFSLSDACRSGVKEAIKELQSLHIKTVMLTGDCNAAAMQAHRELGNALEEVHAELLPEDKAKIINGFKREGPTAMVGDGLNDGPALATANIGISMGISGSALAIETGQVILMSNDMRKIPKAIKLARRAHFKVIQNVVVSIATKTAILVLAFAGHPLIWAAVLADVGTCLLVICNSMLLLQGNTRHGRKSHKFNFTSHSHRHHCHNDSSHSSYHVHHIHKQGCCTGNSDASCHDHHFSSHCSSYQKSHCLCLPRKCASKFQFGTFSERSCTKDGVPRLSLEDDRYAGAIGSNQAECKDQGRCDAHNLHFYSCKIRSQGHSKLSKLDCCKEDRCSKRVREHVHCSKIAGPLEAKHHDHSATCVLHSNKEPLNIYGCHSSHCHMDPVTSQNKCHSSGFDERSFSHQDHIEEAHPDPRSCKDGCCGLLESSTNIDHMETIPRQAYRSEENVEESGNCEKCCPEFADSHLCLSFEKREMGGCCKSCTDCCENHGDFACGFGGGLREIITE